MEYCVLFVLLFILELAYFKLAKKYNIIDKPNLRSSHSSITLRGGGIIFYFGAIAYFIYSGFQYKWFFIGLTLMTIISFLDDIFTLSSRIRLFIHFSSVLLMAFQLDIFEMPWYFLVICFVVVVGVINAYNFMDGINGITATYSIAVLMLLMIANTNLNFIDQRLLIFSFVSVLVFSYFNFRKKAKTFAGDVGSVSIAYILLFSLGALILNTGNLIYLLFLTVYGIDAVLTIVQRMILKENIFEAHRSHLYQYLGNEAGFNKLVISFFYGFIQFIIGLSIIWISSLELYTQVVYTVCLLLILSIVYLIIKSFVLKKYVLISQNEN